MGDTGREANMEPMVVVLAFAAMASGLAILRTVAESRQSNRRIRPVRARRDRYADPAAARFRVAADTLHRLRDS
jgi:hypothetical protein